MRRRIGYGYTRIGSTSYASWWGTCTRESGYLYLRVWRLWVRFGHRKPAVSPAQVITATRSV